MSTIPSAIPCITSIDGDSAEKYTCDPRRCLVILPTYNERDNLESVLAAIESTMEVDTLIVDDASPDGTGLLAQSLSQSRSNLHVIHGTRKSGLGRAYIRAFRWALQRHYEWIISMDCDGSHRAVDLVRLCQNRGADIVIGSRYVPGGRTDGWPLSRRLISRAANEYVRTWLGRNIRDWTGGFRAYRAEILRRIQPDSLASRGYIFQVEILLRAIKQGARVIEVPIVFRRRERGQSKMNWSVLWEGIGRVPHLRRKH